jgi:hypothetical protein
MPSSVKVAAPNALLLVSDVGGGNPPDKMRGALIASTPSCIAVGCMSDTIGKTQVTVGMMQELSPRDPPAFDGKLETPSRAVSIWTVEDETVLQTTVSHQKTRVRVWVNHPTEPNDVVIVLG